MQFFTYQSSAESLLVCYCAQKTARPVTKLCSALEDMLKMFQVFDSSNETLAKAAEEVNTSYEVANANYTDIKQAKHDADELEKDVTEAESEKTTCNLVMLFVAVVCLLLLLLLLLLLGSLPVFLMYLEVETIWPFLFSLASPQICYKLTSNRETNC